MAMLLCCLQIGASRWRFTTCMPARALLLCNYVANIVESSAAGRLQHILPLSPGRARDRWERPRSSNLPGNIQCNENILMPAKQTLQTAWYI